VLVERLEGAFRLALSNDRTELEIALERTSAQELVDGRLGGCGVMYVDVASASTWPAALRRMG
jgi:hypothetical protein